MAFTTTLTTVSEREDWRHPDTLISEDLGGSHQDDEKALDVRKKGQTLEVEEPDYTGPGALSDATTPAEYTSSVGIKIAFLGLYFVSNLAITLSNKAILNVASYPWLLTFCHALATSIGCAVLVATGHLKPVRLSSRDNLLLLGYSVLFTLNIAIGMVALSLVSVAFHQIFRALLPAITVLIYKVTHGRTYSLATYSSLIPLIVGPGLATFGDYQFTAAGFLITLLGVCLAAARGVATNVLMTGSLRLSTMQILLRMMPLTAVQCLIGATLSGEASGFLKDLRARPAGIVLSGPLEPSFLLAVIGNSILAFGLNFVSFRTNKVAGALTMSVCDNCKQIFTIVLGVILFATPITPLSGIGMLIAIAGAAYYSKVELDRRIPVKG